MPSKKSSPSDKEISKSRIPPKALHSLFVIMPFRKALARTKADLDAFYEDNIKKVIDKDRTLKFRYEVSRSGNALDMTDSIIKSIYDADLVLCDLSGLQPNPNVMYELGLRFALGDKPVILIREENADNENIFDIQGLYTYGFSSMRYGDLQKHLIAKMKEFEDNPDSYQSPILKVLNKDSQVINAIMKRQMKSMVHGLVRGLFACQVLLKRRIEFFLPNQSDLSSRPSVDPNGQWEIFAFLKQAQLGLNFRTLDFSPPVIPSMMGLLSFYHFLDVIPKDLSEALYNRLHYLYYHYWAGAALSAHPSQETYFNFICEILDTNNAAIIIEKYLDSDNEEEKAQIANNAIRLLKLI